MGLSFVSAKKAMVKATINEDRLNKLRILAGKVNEKLGADGKVYLGRDHEEFQRIATGLLAFDTITGGGLVRKHYLELFGEESSGKTTVALQCVAAVQRKRGVAAWVVGEEFDDDWAERQGVDVGSLIKIEALSGDLMLETAATYLESGLIDLLVLDSVQAIGTVRELDAGVDSEAYAGGGAPQMWGRFYRRTRSLFNARKSQAAIIGISQVRDKIGGFSGHGPPEPQPTQIRAIKHWKSISIQCKRGEPVFDDPKSEKKRIAKRQFHLRCKKNKTAPPERVSSFWYNFRGEHKGLDYVEEAIRLGKVYGILRQGGKTLTGMGIKVQGSSGKPAVDVFREKLTPKLLAKLRREIVTAATED